VTGIGRGPIRSRTRRFTPWRRAIQAAVALLFLAVPVLNSMGHGGVAGTLIALKVGSIDLLEPASSLSAALAARSAGTWLLVGAAPLVLLAATLGPVFCSWVCPWGLVSEGLDRLRARPWSPRSWERARLPRAIALGLLLALSLLLGTPLAAWVAGPRLATALPLEAIALRVVSPVTGGLLLALLALELLGPRRIWCRALCPAGGLAAYLRTPRTLKVISDPERCHCSSAPHCHARCPWGIDPRLMGRLDGCTGCMACVDACPGGALSVGFALSETSSHRCRGQ
jgi:ferredoxin-type protein NapH